jgi:hypothetical protein
MVGRGSPAHGIRGSRCPRNSGRHPAAASRAKTPPLPPSVPISAPNAAETHLSCDGGHVGEHTCSGGRSGASRRLQTGCGARGDGGPAEASSTTGVVPFWRWCEGKVSGAARESVFLLSSASPNTANYQVNAAVEERPGVLFASAGCQRQKSSSHQHPRNTFEEGVESESERDGTLIL